MAQEMKSLTFKKRTDEDEIDDLKYFWSKTRHIVDNLKKKGYTVDLTETAANVLHAHQQERDRLEPKARSKRSARPLSEGKVR